MSSFDLRAINLMTGVMCVVLGIVILGVRHNFPGTLKGLGLWGLAPLLGMLATLFFGLDGLLPDGMAIIGGNAFALGSCGLLYFGSQRFFEQKVTWRFWGGLGIVSLTGLAFFLLAQPDYRIRVAIFAGTVGLLFAAHTRLLLRHGRGYAARFTMVVMAVQTIIVVVRLLAIYWVDRADASHFTATPIHTLYLASFSFMVLLFLVGAQLMASERIRTEFEHLATYDSLTGALNRRVLQLAGEQELLRWQRYGQSFAVLLLDIDHFKQINDLYGHMVGDQVLKRFVATLRHPLRKSDLVGRYGGEEFVVLLPVTDLTTALVLGERVRAAVEATPAGLLGPACTTSVGVSCVEAGDTSFDALIARADQALYKAKAEGRNRALMLQQETA